MFVNFGDDIINMDFVTSIRRYESINLEKKDPYSIHIRGFHIETCKHFNTEKNRNNVYHELKSFLSASEVRTLINYDKAIREDNK